MDYSITLRPRRGTVERCRAASGSEPSEKCRVWRPLRDAVISDQLPEHRSLSLSRTCTVKPTFAGRLGREMRPGERCGIWALCPNLVPEPARDTTRSAKPAHNLCNLSQQQLQHSHSRSLSV
ncbi:hypothetical protein SRHO_G00156270 [Serrasalmus rhombeus]